MAEIQKLVLGEVLTIPMDFIVYELKMIGPNSPRLILRNEEEDIELRVYSDGHLNKLLKEEP